MPLYKEAQQLADDNQLVLVLPPMDDLEVSADDDADDEELVVELPSDEMPAAVGEDGVLEVSSDEGPVEISFNLHLPGADDTDIEVSSDDEDDDKGEKKEEKKESKDWQSIPKGEFLPWLRSYLDKIPKHKGETIALERAKAYLNRGLDILSKSVQQDFDGEIDISKADDARSEMERGMSRLEKELNRRRKKAMEEQSGLTKEAQKAMGVNSGGVMVTVPILISSIARACVNAVVSNGKDLTTTFDKLAEKYNLNEREKLETIQLLQDMNMPITRDPNLLDDEGYGYSSENNLVRGPNYYS